jgi:Tol biopolymer transport system component
LRATRIAISIAIIIVLFVAAVELHHIGDQHNYVDTVGEIVYAAKPGTGDGNSHIFVVTANGAQVQITTGNCDDTDPAFSPDGSSIAYISDKSGSPQVWLMDADGKGARVMTYGSDSKIKPRFSPDGNRIAYLAGGRLYVMAVSTGSTQLILPSGDQAVSGNTQQLADAAREPVTDFAWCPAASNGNPPISAIQQTPDGDLQTVALVPSFGGAPHVLVGASEIDATWSPDGKQLAVAGMGFAAGPSTPSFSGIVLYDAAGNPVAQPPLAAVAGSQVGLLSPRYSPDGNHIVFDLVHQNNIGVDQGIGIGITGMQPGQPPQVVVRGDAASPEFDPTGNNLIFLGPVQNEPTAQTIFEANMSTGAVTCVGPPAGDVSSAEWSPAVKKAGS